MPKPVYTRTINISAFSCCVLERDRFYLCRPWGALVGRCGCKRLIQFSAGAIFLGLVAASVAPSSALLALSLFLFGASIGAIDVVMNVEASLVEKHSGENLMSGFHGLSSVGGFAGSLVMSGLLWLNTPAGAAALIVVFLLSILLLLANPALLPYGVPRG
jgi:MFS family permease